MSDGLRLLAHIRTVLDQAGVTTLDPCVVTARLPRNGSALVVPAANLIRGNPLRAVLPEGLAWVAARPLAVEPAVGQRPQCLRQEYDVPAREGEDPAPDRVGGGYRAVVFIAALP